MGLISYPQSTVVEISDLVINGTKIKRKAELIHLNYSTEMKSVNVMVKIRPFSETVAEDGSTIYGDDLSQKPGFSSYVRNIIADMTTLVIAETGEIIPGDANTLLNDPANSAAPVDYQPAVEGTPDQPATYDENGVELTPFIPGTPAQPEVLAKPAGILYGKNYMYEYEFFKMIAATQQVIVDDMIINKIKWADALGKLN